MKHKFTIGDAINYLGMVFIAIITLYPFINVVAISLNDAMDTLKGWNIHIPACIYTA